MTSCKSLDLSANTCNPFLCTKGAQHLRKQDNEPRNPLKPAWAPGIQGRVYHPVEGKAGKKLRWSSGEFRAWALSQLARPEVRRKRECLEESLQKEQ